MATWTPDPAIIPWLEVVANATFTAAPIVAVDEEGMPASHYDFEIVGPRPKIIGLHVGGEGRRGDLSDKFLTDTVPACDDVIVVADGNKDGLFTKLTGNGKIPLDSVEKITKVGEPLAKAFK